MLSPTIYFFHDFTSEKNGLLKDSLVHHTIKCNFFSLNEIKNANKIHGLQLDSRFYIFDKAEQLKIAEITPDLASQLDAGIIKSNAGSLLLTFKKRQLMYLDLNLRSLSSSKKYIFQLIEFYRYLLGSINLLVNSNLIHNNINFNTIVVDLSNNLPILTNFSYSIDLSKKSDLTQYFLLRKLDNIFSPVEFFLLQYQLTNKLDSLSLYNIETVIKQFVRDHPILTTFYKEELLDNGLHYFKRYTNKSFHENLSEALKYAKTWDNYALSIVYLKILIGLHKTIKVNNKFIIYFMKLLVEYICIDPSKRPLLSLSSFEEMLNKMELDDYTQLLSVI
jgi:hypothetical protein